MSSSQRNWGQWMQSQGLTWDEVIQDLEKSPKAKALIQRVSRDFLDGREDAMGIAEFLGILAGDV
jgi:hypothetical protein